MKTLLKSGALAALVMVAAPAWAQSPSDVIDATALIDEVGAQSAAPDRMRRDPSMPLGEVQEAWDEAPATAGVYSVAYHPEKVIKLRVRQAMITTVILPEWERVGDIYLGDSYVFSAQKTRPNIIIVRVAYIGADTSMTVVGEASGHVYTFYLRAVGVAAKEVPDVTVNVLAVKPQKVMEAQEAADAPAPAGDVPAAVQLASAAAGREKKASGDGLEDPDYLGEIPFDPTKLRFDYTMSGDKSIAPERVFSDGIFTYFDYGDRWDGTDLPAFYRVVDGVDTPQNVRYKGSMVVVESAGAFTLRNGQRVVCVRPAGWEPEGEYVPPPQAAEDAPKAPRGAAAFK
ncbi:MAG: TrbG/VirB9 family P-type conjugative transfer protein [Kiloniellaceae bacterium]